MVTQNNTKRVRKIDEIENRHNTVVNLSDYRNQTQSRKIKSLLFIDTDLNFFYKIKKSLSSSYYDLFIAHDAMEASKILEERSIDAFVVNTDLPWMDGYETCELLRSLPLLKHLPITLISNNHNEEEERRGFESGCTEFISKPFAETSLPQILEKYL
jgi:PleD family two-component response regulator